MALAPLDSSAPSYWRRLPSVGRSELDKYEIESESEFAMFGVHNVNKSRKSEEQG